MGTCLKLNVQRDSFKTCKLYTCLIYAVYDHGYKRLWRKSGRGSAGVVALAACALELVMLGDFLHDTPPLSSRSLYPFTPKSITAECSRWNR